jgi:excisionase family DNA binding protein
MLSDRLLTPEEAAQYLACSQRQVRRFVASGELRATRLTPRLVRFQVSDLDALISQKAIRHTPPPWPDRRVYRLGSG